MNLIIKTIEEINVALPVPLSMNFDALKPSVRTLQKKWLEVLVSKAELDHWITLINGAESIPALKQEAIDLARASMAPLILRESADVLNINMVQGGFTVNKSEKTDVASANRVLLLKEQLTINAQDGFSQLIDLLEAYPATFDKYRDSEERRERKKLFVNTLKAFNTGLPGMEINHFIYHKMRSVIEVTESRYLIKALGWDLFAELKTNISTSQSLGVYAPILPYIQRAIPSLVLADCLDTLNLKVDERGVYMSVIRNANEPQQTEKGEVSVVESKLRKYASERMEDLVQHLTENSNSYPLFANSETFTNRAVERIGANNKGAYYGLQ
jgi:hypothetical protein